MAFDSSQSFGEDFKIATMRDEAAGFYRSYLKRGFDVLFVLAIALPVLLITGVLALLVATDGKSPFYVQQRVGRNGRIFRMWKLRSMISNADQKLAAYLAQNPDAKREWEVSQKLKHDPRITPIGRLIRKTSMDELPQLWNILVGDMSLVGPRPMLCEQRALYPGTAYYSMRPGLSGYWQTSERNDSSFADRAVHDARYFVDLSLYTDLVVLFRTVFVVLRCTGH